MKNITFVLFVLFLGLTQARYCCSGSYDSSRPLSIDVSRIKCTGDDDQSCSSTSPTGSNQVTISCGNSTAATQCDFDYCNCPAGFGPRLAESLISEIGEMKKIMYPVMGVIFGVIWVILAFIGSRLPLTALLIIVGLLDALFGICLIFLPVTTFLGLFYIAVGAFTIAIARHSWGGDTGIDFLLALTLIVFLLTGGLTFVAYDFGQGHNYVNRISSYTPFCDGDMNIMSGNRLSQRCDNYLLFIIFSVYLLFLIQPIAMIAAAFKRRGHHTETTVVVNEEHHHSREQHSREHHSREHHSRHSQEHSHELEEEKHHHHHKHKRDSNK